MIFSKPSYQIKKSHSLSSFIYQLLYKQDKFSKMIDETATKLEKINQNIVIQLIHRMISKDFVSFVSFNDHLFKLV